MKSNRYSVRKAGEAYLIDRGQTLEPPGEMKHDTFSSFFFLRVFFVCVCVCVCVHFFCGGGGYLFGIFPLSNFQL